MTIGSEGQVLNPVTANNPVSSNQLPPLMGRQGDLAVSELHGKYFTAALNKSLFAFMRTNVTLPVITTGVVSVFSVWNPPGSGVLGEFVDTELGQTNAATLVNVIGWYFSSGATALAGTFTTPAVANTSYVAGRVGDAVTNIIVPYTAYTHSGTPVRVDMIASFGAITDPVVVGGNGAGGKVYDGRLWIAPGTAMSVCASTAAETTADVSCRWIEWPFA